jgi:DnaD/phage-associated family protein
VLLYILRHSEGFAAEKALSDLSVSDAVFDRAIGFWIAKGVLANRGGEIMLNTDIITVAKKAPVAEIKASRPEYDFVQISDTITKDKQLSALLASVQSRFSKPLSSASVKSLYMLYDYYGFPTEVIFSLVSYCTQSGHESFKYIEQVALDWYSKGITTEERAAHHIAQLEEKRSHEYAARRIFGIGDRGFTQKEKNMIAKWFDSFGFGEDMLTAAFERCVAATGKLSLTYIDKILEKWSAAGIKTVQEADKADEDFETTKKAPRSKKNAAPVKGEKTYDVDDFVDWSYNTFYADTEDKK